MVRASREPSVVSFRTYALRSYPSVFFVFFLLLFRCVFLMASLSVRRRAPRCDAAWWSGPPPDVPPRAADGGRPERAAVARQEHGAAVIGPLPARPRLASHRLVSYPPHGPPRGPRGLLSCTVPSASVPRPGPGPGLRLGPASLGNPGQGRGRAGAGRGLQRSPRTARGRRLPGAGLPRGAGWPTRENPRKQDDCGDNAESCAGGRAAAAVGRPSPMPLAVQNRPLPCVSCYRCNRCHRCYRRASSKPWRLWLYQWGVPSSAELTRAGRTSCRRWSFISK